MAYAERMLARDLRAYSAAQTLSGPVIFDRGIPDIMGYLTLCDLPAPPHLTAAAKAALSKPSAARAALMDCDGEAMPTVRGHGRSHRLNSMCRSRSEAAGTVPQDQPRR